MDQTAPFPSTGCIASPARGREGLAVLLHGLLPRAGDAIHPVLGKGVVWSTRLGKELYIAI